MIKVKSLGLQTIVTTIFGLSLIGCSSGSSSENSSPTSTVKEAQLVDSAIQGVDYTTNSLSGITDESGTFQYNSTDTTITFKVGSLTLADFNLSKLNSDNKLLPADIFDVNRTNTTDANLLKFIRVVQSLDNDNNPDNGILIDDNTKGFLSTDINIKDANISQLQTIMTNANKTLKLERASREHYKSTLSGMGISPQFAPFVTVWETTASDNNITIPTNSNYTYNYTVDWGDGIIENNITGDKTHIYSVDGNHTVQISGEFPSLKMIQGEYLWPETNEEISNASQLKKLIKWGDIQWKDMENMFAETSSLNIEATDTPILSNTTSMKCMFYFAYNIQINNINDWNVSNIINMSHLFSSTFTFDKNISAWDVSNVTTMRNMFESTNFNQDISSWDVSNVTDMQAMFNYATKFNQNISNWNVNNVTNMSWMFRNATSFTNQDLTNWNVNKVAISENFMDGAGSGNIIPPLLQKLTHNGTTYGQVYSPYTGRIWLDRNLGASKICSLSRDAKDENNNSIFADDDAYVSSQQNCFGDYYQWGRNADGHEKSNSSTSTTIYTGSSFDGNISTSFIIDGDNADDDGANFDWASEDDNGSLRSSIWSKTDGSSICPIGFRVATIDELKAETIDIGVNNRDNAFNNFLKLPSAGYSSGGTYYDKGKYGILWSLSTDQFYSIGLNFYIDDIGNYSMYRVGGNTVRCIKDDAI